MFKSFAQVTISGPNGPADLVSLEEISSKYLHTFLQGGAYARFNKWKNGFRRNSWVKRSPVLAATRIVIFPIAAFFHVDSNDLETIVRSGRGER